MAELLDENELNEVTGGVELQGFFSYKLSPEDSLPAVALRFGTTVNNLLHLNNVNSEDEIRVKRSIIVPKKGLFSFFR